MEKLKVDGICLDFGNTLVLDPFEKVLKFKSVEFKKILRENGHDFGSEEIFNAWDRANNEIDYPFISHFYQEIPILKQTLARLGVKKSDRERIASHMLVAYRNGLKTVIKRDERNKEVISVLEKLKVGRKKIMVFSNDRVDDIVNIMKWSGIGKVVEKIMVSESLGLEKPDPRVFIYILKALGTARERTVYIGDDPKRDIEPAKMLGMKTILYVPENAKSTPWRSYNVIGKYKPDFVVKRFSELLNILE